MPIGLDLDGYFHCEKGKTEYRVLYEHHASPDADWSRIPYCESVRYNVYIGPEGRLAPCMGFSDTALKERFPSVLESHLSDITLDSYYHDVVETKAADLINKNPECGTCPHLNMCCGGCMVQDITDAGDYLVPDSRCCYFYKHIGPQAVRQVADEGIKAAGRG